MLSNEAVKSKYQRTMALPKDTQQKHKSSIVVNYAKLIWFTVLQENDKSIVQSNAPKVDLSEINMYHQHTVYLVSIFIFVSL